MAKRKKMTADEKADQKVKYYQSLEDKYQKRWKNSEQKGMDTYKKMQATNDKKEKAKLNTRWKKITKTVGADNNARKRYKKLRENAESERDALHKQQGDLAAIADKIAQHNAQFSIDPSSSSNEGHAAIYPSDGSQNPIFISPSDNESEDTTSNVTSYPVDEGAPRADYVRVASKTVSVGGIITGRNRAEANEKFAKLQSWHNHHKTLTYQGDINYKHLAINDLQNTYSDLRDNLKVSIGFTFIYWAQVTTSTGKNAKKKTSKSSKRVAGSRNKKYTAITVKKGQTLLGIAKRYNTSVKWLQKVNHIKNPNKIDAGQHMYVGKKTNKKARGKIRVK
ncbi:LysM peptidoglycan-binding domain-containing protein [Lactobacillus helveticus]|uniref:LysM peptidoglycan-binding domain-containing protein n=1 Tax=Lactobacillus helveticus TaxID=1587 RepID=UPI001C64A63A|nr:LysM domain-containing protein [Lactobacillus helveticus]MBW8009350.1 LysM domain-containing protein [Lactobacillus helveticus]MBW8019395.1 LysM domain-containing protein [Lactobacillus helveticus]MBW8042675.1 LysM domain-containing protein [Lactobacillus helveticus]MBW8052334.1 LysM domain-containing protein [Lactobacillus helveticus]